MEETSRPVRTRRLGGRPAAEDRVTAEAEPRPRLDADLPAAATYDNPDSAYEEKQRRRLDNSEVRRSGQRERRRIDVQDGGGRVASSQHSYPVVSALMIDKEDLLDDDEVLPEETANVLFEEGPVASTKQHEVVYVETLLTGKFRRVLQPTGYVRLAVDEEEDDYDPQKEEKLQLEKLSTAVQRLTSSLQVGFWFCQGLLSGLAVLHIYLVWSPANQTAFLAFYSPIARGIGQLFYIFSTISLVGSLQRFSMERAAARKWRTQSLAAPRLPADKARYFFVVVSLLCFLVCFLCCLANWSFDQILYHKNAYLGSWWVSSPPDGTFNARQSVWTALSLLRLLSASLGWIFVVSKTRWHEAVAVVPSRVELRSVSGTNKTDDRYAGHKKVVRMAQDVDRS
eukprot:GILK01008292.1.p1 GENE.GILK01008292.1~~GILK01008292.1.p1  ORF type:complete len:416 (+),score=59.41 GILK01008292.1:60-1250(+)